MVAKKNKLWIYLGLGKKFFDPNFIRRYRTRAPPPVFLFFYFIFRLKHIKTKCSLGKKSFGQKIIGQIRIDQLRIGQIICGQMKFGHKIFGQMK